MPLARSIRWRSLQHGGLEQLRINDWGDSIKVRCHVLRDGSRGCLLGFLKVVGQFVNSVPIRGRLDGEASFRGLVAQLHATVREALDAQNPVRGAGVGQPVGEEEDPGVGPDRQRGLT